MLGNTLALLCALSWSLSIILLKISGARIHPLALNLGKNLLGLVLLLLTVWALEGGLVWPADPSDTAWLLLSGFIGIGLADGLVLKAMRYLPAGHVAILECFFAPFVIILSLLLLDETLSLNTLIGGSLILASLFCLAPGGGPRAAGELRGIVLMMLGLFMIAYGIVAIKPLMNRVPLFSLVAIRMMAGVFGSALVFAGVKDKRREISDAWRDAHKPTLFAACFFSAYVSIILWVAGYKYLEASAAALLNQTSTIFTVLLAVVFLNERLDRRKILATGLAMAGVALITLAAQ